MISATEPYHFVYLKESFQGFDPIIITNQYEALLNHTFDSVASSKVVVVLLKLISAARIITYITYALPRGYIKARVSRKEILFCNLSLKFHE